VNFLAGKFVWHFRVYRISHGAKIYDSNRSAASNGPIPHYHIETEIFPRKALRAAQAEAKSS
jgi:hypothetical protein